MDKLVAKINNRIKELDAAQGMHPAQKAGLIRENKRFLAWIQMRGIADEKKFKQEPTIKMCGHFNFKECYYYRDNERGCFGCTKTFKQYQSNNHQIKQQQ